VPQATKHQSHRTTKLLNLGDAGSGKTGALASLAKAGQRLIILDFDNGLDILIGLLKNDQKALEHIYYETFTDELMMGPQDMIITKGKPTAFTSAMKGLTKWEFPVERGSKETYNLGNSGDWGPDTTIVIDSLGFAADAALRFVRQKNMHQFEEFVSQPDYGQAMSRVENMLQLLYSDAIKCNVIVNTHIVYLEDVLKGTLKGLPRALGSKLPPKVGGYFNTIVRTMTEGQGRSQKRVIKTASDIGTELKLPVAPGTIPDTLPIEDGLVTIFNALKTEEWIEIPD
jgi:hypothetical protein